MSALTRTLTGHPRVLAAILDRAATHIETAGWWKHGYGADADGVPLAQCPACAAGAVNVATVRQLIAILNWNDAGAHDLRRDGRRVLQGRNAKVAVLEYLGHGWEPCECELGDECWHDTESQWVRGADERLGNWNDAQTHPEPVVLALRATARQLRATA